MRLDNTREKVCWQSYIAKNILARIAVLGSSSKVSCTNKSTFISALFCLYWLDSGELVKNQYNENSAVFPKLDLLLCQSRLKLIFFLNNYSYDFCFLGFNFLLLVLICILQASLIQVLNYFYQTKIKISPLGIIILICFVVFSLADLFKNIHHLYSGKTLFA